MEGGGGEGIGKGGRLRWVRWNRGVEGEICVGICSDNEGVDGSGDIYFGRHKTSAIVLYITKDTISIPSTIQFHKRLMRYHQPYV